MARMKQKIGDASMEAEGTEATIAAACRLFHLALAEARLREIDRELAPLVEVKKQRRKLLDFIKTLEQPQAAGAVDPSAEVLES